MKQLKNYWILEYSKSENNFIAITLKEQIITNRNYILNEIHHDYIPIMYFNTKEELEIEAEKLKIILNNKTNKNEQIKQR